jgi:5-(carboxyamino)imidazole ribonucleotide synthase
MQSKTIGILGGGQLGKMLIEAGYPMSIQYNVLENGKDFPCKSVLAGTHIEGTLYNREAILELDNISDVLTYEIEHLDVSVLRECKSQVFPKVQVLTIIQDKGLQKQFFDQHNIDTLPYTIVSREEILTTIREHSQEKMVIKSRKGGYDGQGVWIIDKSVFVENYKLEQWNNPAGYIIEQFIPNTQELSVLVAVDQQGNASHYEVSEMVFNPEANLMDYLISPANISTKLSEKAKELSLKVVRALNSPGIFAVELFVDKNSNIFVNEIAPRPHNSGHHTIESCETSQYAQLNRILMGWPLGSTVQKGVALTCNILGPKNMNGAYQLNGLEEALKISGVYIHMYNKTTTKPYRKLGHFTITAENRATALDKMNRVRDLLKVES